MNEGRFRRFSLEFRCHFGFMMPNDYHKQVEDKTICWKFWARSISESFLLEKWLIFTIFQFFSKTIWQAQYWDIKPQRKSKHWLFVFWYYWELWNSHCVQKFMCFPMGFSQSLIQPQLGLKLGSFSAFAWANFELKKSSFWKSW